MMGSMLVVVRKRILKKRKKKEGKMKRRQNKNKRMRYRSHKQSYESEKKKNRRERNNEVKKWDVSKNKIERKEKVEREKDCFLNEWALLHIQCTPKSSRSDSPLSVTWIHFLHFWLWRLRQGNDYVYKRLSNPGKKFCDITQNRADTDVVHTHTYIHTYIQRERVRGGALIVMVIGVGY